MQETPVRLLGWALVGKIHWGRDRLPTPVFLGFPGDSARKESPAMWETWVQFLGWEDPQDTGNREAFKEEMTFKSKYKGKIELSQVKQVYF